MLGVANYLEANGYSQLNLWIHPLDSPGRICLRLDYLAVAPYFLLPIPVPISVPASILFLSPLLIP
jgi:hypothetical protein